MIRAPGLALTYPTNRLPCRWPVFARYRTKRAETARQRLRLEGYYRNHLRSLAQPVEVADDGVRSMGSKTRLLQALIAKTGVNSVPTQGLKWRRRSPPPP